MGLVRGWSGWARSGGCSAGACRWCPGSRPLPSVLTRPLTDATARRPQPRSCASEQRRRTRPCQHRQNGIPHHPKVAGGVARSRPGRSWALPVLRGRISRVSGPAAVRRRGQALAGVGRAGTTRAVAGRQAPLGTLDFSWPGGSSGTCRSIRRSRGRISMPLGRGKRGSADRTTRRCPYRAGRSCVGAFPGRTDHEATPGLRAGSEAVVDRADRRATR
jgi:hypothetical protein